MSLLGRILEHIVARTVLVCRQCVRPTDRVVGAAGDFSCCERCQKSITSKTGRSVVPIHESPPKPPGA